MNATAIRPFSLLVKPASADCNLRCRYCFYIDRLGLYPENRVHRMSDATLEAMIRTFMATPQSQYAFGWQGGEPTLMGLPFFERIVELQQRHGKQGTVVCNGLQTNATLIDELMARHFGAYNYLVGVSLDGPPEVHDHYRKNIGGAGTHAAVMRGIENLKQHNVAFNILTLVNDRVAARGGGIYRYLREQGFLYHQYIPCVEFDETGALRPFAVEGKAWGAFLCAVFDEWIKTDTRTVSVRLFDTILQYYIEGVRNTCSMGRDCRQYFVVEYNGDIYPCDFFVYDDLRLGNVRAVDWAALQQSQAYADFGILKQQVNPACRACPYLEVCVGDCLKHRFRRGRDPEQLTSLCEGWKMFYEHTLDDFRRLAKEYLAERAAEAGRARARAGMPSRPAPSRKPRPNDPCPCGSGKKHKKCCGR